MMGDKNKYTLITLALLLISVAALYFVSKIAERSAIATQQEEMRSILTFQKANLKNSLDKYAVMSVVIARRPDVVTALNKKELVPGIPNSDYLTTIIAGLSGANDIWLVGREGVVFASNTNQSIGLSVESENYFIAAMEGRLGRGFSVTEDNRRYYIFTAPVFDQQSVVGVVVVRVDIDFIERVWALLLDPIIVTDENQKIILSNVEAWRLNAFYSDKGARRENQNDTLVKEFSGNDREGLLLNQPYGQKREQKFLHYQDSIPLLEWDIHVLAAYSGIVHHRNIALLVTFLVLSLVLLCVWVWLMQMNQQKVEKRAQQAFALRLERQVRDRTRALSLTNERLEIEVDERKQIEKELREAQEELVQTAKLAGIGQMSAALAHEYNQPLTAIRSYADNAKLFIQRQQINNAEDNLDRIQLLVDKMASLTKTLKGFAHKSESDQLRSLVVKDIMDELVILLSPQAKKLQVELSILPPSSLLSVLAEPSHLSQVLSNLITNAMDAVENSSNKIVEVTWFLDADDIVIRVRDSGPGIPVSIREKLFEPFYTTKSAATGLGLGLFIAMNIIKRLKGDLSISNEKGYGAVFDVRLPQG